MPNSCKCYGDSTEPSRVLSNSRSRSRVRRSNVSPLFSWSLLIFVDMRLIRSNVYLSFFTNMICFGQIYEPYIKGKHNNMLSTEQWAPHKCKNVAEAMGFLRDLPLHNNNTKGCSVQGINQQCKLLTSLELTDTFCVLSGNATLWPSHSGLPYAMAY